MRQFLAIGLVALSAAACQSLPESAASPHLGLSQSASRDQGNNTVMQDAGKHTLVSLSRQTSDSSRPFQEYGTVFTVSVVNLGNQPVAFGPESITVTRDGMQIAAMSRAQLQAIANKLEADRQDEVRAKQFLGTLLGQIGGQVANQTAAQILNVSSAMLDFSANQDIRDNTRTKAEAAELMQQFSSTSLSSSSVPNMKAVGGWILVEGLNKADRYRVTVTAGGEAHNFDFGPSVQASR